MWRKLCPRDSWKPKNNKLICEDCVLTGGGIALHHAGSAVITENTIRSNYGGAEGGGIWAAVVSGIEISGNDIYGNTAESGGGGVAIWLSSGAITDNIIRNDTVFGDTGASGGGIACAYVGELFIEDNLIEWNIAPRGAGIAIAIGSPEVLGNIISNNAATDPLPMGAGVYVLSEPGSPPANPRFRENQIVSNSPAGIRIEGSDASTKPDFGNIGNDDPGYNTIMDNSQWNIYNDNPNSIMAEGNWWGAFADSAMIDSLIYDDDEDPSSGPVDFDPWILEAFIRGDANGDGEVTGADATYIINYLYRGGPPPPCMDAGDANDDGFVTGADRTYILVFLYLDGPPPPFPYPDCGPDPTADNLDCGCHPPCMGCMPMASGPPEFGGNLWLGDATLTEDKLIVPVYLENIKTLHLFGWKVSYDPQLLTAESVDSSGLVTEKFDFFGAKKNIEEGWVRAGAMVSWTLDRVLPPGSYQVATMVFELKTDRVNPTEVLSLSDIELVDPQGTILRVGTGGGAMSSFSVTPPLVFRLLQSRPNPFASEVAIAYSIAKTSQVCLKIYDSSGRLVRILVNEQKDPGYHTAHWDGKTDNGKEVSSGIYFYRIKAGDYKATRKLVRVK